jgi:transcriptional regulator of acetoin/glycerol metabolism
MRALEETGGNRTEAAKKLGISRRTLHRRLKELHLPE